jgi:hypothetical protein
MIARWGVVIAAVAVACNYDEYMRTAPADRHEAALVGDHPGFGEYRRLNLRADGTLVVDRDLGCDPIPCKPGQEPTPLIGSWKSTALKKNHGAVELTIGGVVFRKRVLPGADGAPTIETK